MIDRLVKYFLWLLFPSRCVCCNRLLKRNEQICAECESKLEYTKKPCNICGCEKKACVCKHRAFHFTGAASPFSRGEYSKEIVNNFKFRGNIAVAEFLSENMAASVIERFPNVSFDFVTSVPMHPLKRFANGFNQSEVLARKIAAILNIPYKACLHKIKRNKTQHKAPFKERFNNVKNVFSCDKITAENVLLVDDVKTTGATLDECSRQLLFGGAHNVYCITAISNNYKKQTVEK